MCGSAGQSAVLLDLWAMTGDEVWLDRATGLAERAVIRAGASMSKSCSLFKCDLGIVLVYLDTAFPILARVVGNPDSHRSCQRRVRVV